MLRVVHLGLRLLLTATAIVSLDIPLDALAEPARGGFRRYLGWAVARLPIPHDWARAREPHAPLGRRGVAGEAVGGEELLDAVVAAYRVRASLARGGWSERGGEYRWCDVRWCADAPSLTTSWQPEGSPTVHHRRKDVGWAPGDYRRHLVCSVAAIDITFGRRTSNLDRTIDQDTLCFPFAACSCSARCYWPAPIWRLTRRRIDTCHWRSMPCPSARYRVPRVKRRYGT